jgi:hypothetical protein
MRLLAAIIVRTFMLRSALFLSLIAGGCGGRVSASREMQLCAHIADTCSGNRVDSTCVADMQAVRDSVSAAEYDRFLTCGSEAASCEELAGCVLGGMALEAERTEQRVRRGLDKMLDRLGAPKTPPSSSDPDDRNRARMADDASLPAECHRISDVCASDDTLVRRQCRDMVGKLKADPAHRSKLAACMTKTGNCYDAEKCIDDLWFELK